MHLSILRKQEDDLYEHLLDTTSFSIVSEHCGGSQKQHKINFTLTDVSIDDLPVYHKLLSGFKCAIMIHIEGHSDYLYKDVRPQLIECNFGSSHIEYEGIFRTM